MVSRSQRVISAYPNGTVCAISCDRWGAPQQSSHARAQRPCRLAAAPHKGTLLWRTLSQGCAPHFRADWLAGRLYWDRRRPGGTRSRPRRRPQATWSPAAAGRRDGGGPSRDPARKCGAHPCRSAAGTHIRRYRPQARCAHQHVAPAAAHTSTTRPARGAGPRSTPPRRDQRGRCRSGRSRSGRRE